MRRIGSLSNAADAQRFCDYLITLSVDAMPDEDEVDGQKQWHIWIRDEEQVDKGREELAAFRESPSDEKYSVKAKADKIRDERIAENQRRLKNQQNYSQKMTSRGAGGGAMAGLPVRQQNIPVTIAIIVISVICAFATDMGNPNRSRQPEQLSSEEQIHHALSFVDRLEYLKSGGDPYASIKRGEVWRLITPMFLHGSMMHLVFNMMAMYFLGSVLERIHGSFFFLALAVGTHILGMIVQVMLPDAEALPPVLHRLAGSPFAIGASGAVYGLFGYLWVRPAIDARYPIRIPQINIVMMLGWLVAGIFVVNGIANGAHIGGLVGGILFAVASVKMFRPET